MTPVEKVALLRAACCVAGIDKEISAQEEAVIRRLAKEVGVGKASLQAMMAPHGNRLRPMETRSVSKEPSASEPHCLQFSLPAESPRSESATPHEPT